MTELNRDQVDLERMECVVHGKGNKERYVYLDEVAAMLLGEYLSHRKDDNPALFVGCRKERLEPGGARVMLKRVAEKAGVDHVHPHKFRRTRATELSKHGMELPELAKFLGHERVDTSMTYVVINKDDIKSSFRRYA